ncbi:MULTISPECIES: ArsR/SmtB family transcription factor [Arthrobacter]|uniref:Metalloregulator ArsR/SmtB family transcription factor n=1 Tax=Arthrobacter caoxuetaonis TaxID=2886935 RepID=A0A9X1MH07_9MICC|nr:metalloregulator ArsR/SmtB family transcription factor [Arthrobacter caoxuetaonis]MCC3283803.1 metalloregulator ArsR/SmtB family transcription factor [Arthrobacter caoxuetaonis]MCC3299055.1 metalloregulator ArsR/SmtB family transcription factor [Arthrobacter caoxuetaonis]MCC9193240.1 metalloregulator ArsR/SmtB family transcription factor [Arthrobacter sp. zg-Y916]USQ58608.1 metalloregulator ArsR/SmtB family transcription factor [Arthrobacter caoxuetaonis]
MNAAQTVPETAAAECCTPLTRDVLSAEDAQRFAQLLKAVAEPTRLRLVSIIAAQENQEACVCDLTEPVGLGQPTVSHHLKILVDAGILHRDKRGVWAYYSIVPGALERAAAVLSPR